MPEERDDRGSQYVADESNSKHRENPYLRRNRVKEKRQTENRKKKDEPTVGKTETFATRNVKLITFLICLGIFLLILGPISIFRIINYTEEMQKKAEDAAHPAMTIKNAEGIAQLGKETKWTQLERFSHEDRSNDGFRLWVFPVDSDYEMWAGGESKSQSPGYIYLIRLDDGSRVDLMKESFYGFINGTSDSK